ncbi:hypothetical protein EMIHUDRAFT_122763 [Emiliania huxleyi CCMP1516]|uniref:HNH nuclease domain-containing protein n=2 Tax=Emiliania huxleyi TaxID=2903 RepID=A0A0D3KFR2_EMIH1|nr:hypothetical protein EMIHUDRAFT_122763 [Emiliania huxleyi CCMP1516]EOD34597.1 hypothetical protein EMIHUDRAFT_122763 [Emiliania huxleyi CCMP1516]|eukprot:XP_005787026.1 hypothetical protein EMIHUDRAFT_122763 [Emiliania huxleyi CCMP1516]
MGYANLKKTISTGKMLKQIDEEFLEMTPQEFEFHALKAFYEPRPGRGGYQFKTIPTGPAGNGKSRMFDVDHVVPRKWGGIDHPRNMVVMHSSMNRAFGADMPEAKWFYLCSSSSCRSSGVLRQVAAFFKEIYGNKEVKKAFENAIKNLKDLGGGPRDRAAVAASRGHVGTGELLLQLDSEMPAPAELRKLIADLSARLGESASQREAVDAALTLAQELLSAGQDVFPLTAVPDLPGLIGRLSPRGLAARAPRNPLGTFSGPPWSVPVGLALVSRALAVLLAKSAEQG